MILLCCCCFPTYSIQSTCMGKENYNCFFCFSILLLVPFLMKCSFIFDLILWFGWCWIVFEFLFDVMFWDVLLCRLRWFPNLILWRRTMYSVCYFNQQFQVLCSIRFKQSVVDPKNSSSKILTTNIFFVKKKKKSGLDFKILSLLTETPISCGQFCYKDLSMIINT